MPIAEVLPPSHLLIAASSIGALIGLQRSWEGKPQAVSLRGLTAFLLCALLGAFAAWDGRLFRLPVVFVLAGSLAALLPWIVLRCRFGPAGHRGFVTALAGILTFLIGSLLVWGQAMVAVILALGLLLLTWVRFPHQWTSRGWGSGDLRVLLRFAAVSGVILPLAPFLGPWPQEFGLPDPAMLWKTVMLVSTLSLVGFLAIRLVGKRCGLAAVASFGGLISATATTAALGRLSAERSSLSRACGVAILLSGTVSLWRVAILAVVADGRVIAVIWPWLLLASLPVVLWVLVRVVQDGPGAGGLMGPAVAGLSHGENPLGASRVWRFLLIYTMIALVLRGALVVAGMGGLFAGGALCGFVDRNAVALAVAHLSVAGALDPVTACRVILLALLSGTMLRIVLTLMLGSTALRREVVPVLGMIALCLLAAVFSLR
jgi:uncharacterized membrane protein (DUF4010 family)